MELIDKAAVVTEIERLLAFYLKEIEGNKEDPWAMDIAKRDILQEILSFLDTLEVKEVDLDFQWFAKEMDAVFALPSSETKNTEENPLNWEYVIAKHFFELGMSVSNKTQKREEVC